MDMSTERERVIQECIEVVAALLDQPKTMGQEIGIKKALAVLEELRHNSVDFGWE